MTVCAACALVAEDPVLVRGLEDAPGVAEVCRPCLSEVLARMRLHPSPPSLREELDAIFEDDAALTGPD